MKSELNELKQIYKLFTKKIEESCPNGAEKSLAKRKARESFMWIKEAFEAK